MQLPKPRNCLSSTSNMAFHTSVAASMSEGSLEHRGQEKLLNGYSSIDLLLNSGCPSSASSRTGSTSLRRLSPLPSSPNLESKPNGKTHAGEVRRRTNRQTEPLPAPIAGQSSDGNPSNGLPHRGRRANGSNNGGYPSDSDSEDDNRRRRLEDGRDDLPVAKARQEKRPAASPT